MLKNALTIALIAMGCAAQTLPADPEVSQNSQQGLAPRAVADSQPGGGSGTSAIRGMTRNPSGLPLGTVKVLVQSGGNGPDREALSGPDGAFALEMKSLTMRRLTMQG
jgi:hypothetical protein